MNILMTGATGFVGKWVLESLRDEAVTVISRKCIDGCRTILCEGYNFGQIQIKDKYETLLLLGAKTPKGDNKETIQDYISNIYSIDALLSNLKMPPKKIVFVSSVSVYENTPLINENTPLSVADNYGLSKIMCENILKEYSDKNEIELLIVRVGNVYGPGEETYKKLVGTFLKKARNNEDIIINASGEELRNLVYVGDVANFLAESLIQNYTGIVNCVSSHNYTVKTIAQKIVEAADSKSKIIIKNEFEGRNDSFDASKYKLLRGRLWHETPLEIGIQKMIEDGKF